MTHVAYLAPELGALTGTFVYRELGELRQQDVTVSTFGTYAPRDRVVSQEARAVIDSTDYLYARSIPSLLRSATRAALRRPYSFARTLAHAIADAAAAPVSGPLDRPKLLWHFFVGTALADELQTRRVDHLHAHFAHVPTAIAMYGALAAGIPYSFTCHANDIFERPTALPQKVARSSFAACISEFNREYLKGLGCDPSRLEVVRCGIDLREYPLRLPRPVSSPARVLAVGRLVEKKGFAYLIEAAHLLQEAGVKVKVEVAGDGPLRHDLESDLSRLGLGERVYLLGSQPQERVRELLTEADVFVLPCVVAADGDQDGIPVSLMEAMALGVPVLSTRVSGIPELIQHDLSGLLVDQRDARCLAESLARLLTDEALRTRLVPSARARIEEEFGLQQNAARLRNHIEAGLRPETPR